VPHPAGEGPPPPLPRQPNKQPNTHFYDDMTDIIKCPKYSVCTFSESSLALDFF
jgi:hypothetical protein